MYVNFKIYFEFEKSRFAKCKVVKIVYSNISMHYCKQV